MSSGTSDIAGHTKGSTNCRNKNHEILNQISDSVEAKRLAFTGSLKQTTEESKNKGTRLSVSCDKNRKCNNNHHLSKDITKDNNMLNSKQNLSKTKRLSFLRDKDDSSNDSSSVSLSPKLVSTKWTTDSGDPEVNISNQHIRQAVSTANNNDSVKVLRRVEHGHEDASSTSSCSCEDHSSVASPSEDLHDLDYDEDSITNSPPNNTNPINDMNGSTNDSQNSSSLQITDKHSSSIVSSNQSLIEPNEKETTSSVIAQPTEPIEDSPKELRDGDYKTNLQTPRIRSFVNVDQASINPLNQVDLKAAKKSTNDKSQKSYESLLKYFFRDACYFQIKSINHENVKISKSMGVWSTPIQNEIRLNTAFREHKNVILIFSVQQSGGFQGFARMVSEARPPTRTVPWILPERLSSRSLGGVFQVEWLSTKELPFNEVQNLYNPYNDNKPVKVARDGQQVEPSVGKKLCKLFPKDSKKKLLNSISTLKYQSSQRKKMSTKHSLYPLPEHRARPLNDRPNFIPQYGDHEFPVNPNFMATQMHPDLYGLEIDRPFDRRRAFELQDPSLCRPDFNSPSWRPARPYNLPPRHLVSHMNITFPSHQAYPNIEPPFNSYRARNYSFHTERYRPYQRFRR